MSKTTIITLSLIIGLVLTFASGFYERTFTGVVGNVCQMTEENPGGLCYEELPMIGYPFAYIKDSGGHSVVGSVEIDDNIIGWAFLLDWLIYSIVIAVILFIYKNISKHE